MNYQTLQVFRPLLSSRITQGWAENRACIDSRGRIFGVTKICPPGSQSFYKSVGMQGHNGLDISAWTGEEIYHAATFSGWWRSEVDAAGGIGVDVVSFEPLFFKGAIPYAIKDTATYHEQNGHTGFIHFVKMRYWHLSKALGNEKKHITTGTVIGLAGNTGASSATHLHFSPKWCLEDGRGTGSDNGFFGAFDMGGAYIHSATARDHAQLLNKEIVPLNAEERKDMLSQLSAARQILLTLQKLSHKL